MPTRARPRLALLAAVVLTMGVLSACARTTASSAPSTVVVPADRYAEAFAATRDILARQGYRLERVDARAGVITTAPRRAAGFATPWDLAQHPASSDAMLSDTLNRQQRHVRIEFIPVETVEPERPGRSPAAAPDPIDPDDDHIFPEDLRRYDGSLRMHVRVTLERVQRPGFRASPASIRLHTIAEDPALRDRGLWAEYAVPVARDRAHERRLTQALAERLGTAR